MDFLEWLAEELMETDEEELEIGFDEETTLEDII